MQYFESAPMYCDSIKSRDKYIVPALLYTTIYDNLTRHSQRFVLISSVMSTYNLNGITHLYMINNTAPCHRLSFLSLRLTTSWTILFIPLPLIHPTTREVKLLSPCEGFISSSWFDFMPHHRTKGLKTNKSQNREIST